VYFLLLLFLFSDYSTRWSLIARGGRADRHPSCGRAGRLGGRADRQAWPISRRGGGRGRSAFRRLGAEHTTEEH
jgi:hypothetical protein